MTRKLIDLILFANIWISLGAVGVSMTTFILCNIKIDIYYLILVFFATLFGYNLQNLSSRTINKDRSKQMVWIQSNFSFLKMIVLVSLFFTILFSFYSLSLEAATLSIPFLLLVVCYRFSIFKKIKFRTIPGLKIFIIVICWSWTCCLLPQLLFTSQISWPLVLFISFYIFIITIPFDVRDLSFDEQIKTIPQMIGRQNSFLLIISFLILLLFYTVFNNYFKISVFLFLTILVLIPSKNKNNEYYYLLIIDGLLILMPIFVL